MTLNGVVKCESKIKIPDHDIKNLSCLNKSCNNLNNTLIAGRIAAVICGGRQSVRDGGFTGEVPAGGGVSLGRGEFLAELGRGELRAGEF